MPDSKLKALLLKARSNVYLDCYRGIIIVDETVGSWERQLPKLKVADQARLSTAISSSKDRVVSFDKTLTILFQKDTLEMLKQYISSDTALVDVVKGILDYITLGEVGNRAKFDIWIPSDPKHQFGIWVSPEETKAIIHKAGVQDVSDLQGYTGLSATNLPPHVILSHVIPRALVELVRWKQPIDETKKVTALSLYFYEVALG